MDDKAPVDTGWSFHNEEPEQSAPTQVTPKQSHEPVTWTASEFIANHKNPMWYMILLIGTVALSALMFFVFHDVISIVFIVIVSILFAVLGGKKPRQLPYQVDDQGVTINGQLYPYSIFKSFSVLHEGPVGNINLLPLKRLMPEISIYFAIEDEQKIIDTLVGNLPYDHQEERVFDRIMKKLHF